MTPEEELDFQSNRYGPRMMTIMRLRTGRIVLCDSSRQPVATFPASSLDHPIVELLANPRIPVPPKRSVPSARSAIASLDLGDL